MKGRFVSLVIALAIVVAIVDRAAADGALTNHIGYAKTHVNVGATSIDIADYFSVYRFDEQLFGAFDVLIFDNRTPLTAANFRSYADAGAYTNTFVHRSVNTADAGIGIVQSGGFAFTNEQPGYYVPSGPPVVNEPFIANTQGTIALAKTAAGPDSGTNQWYFNTADNPALDNPANNGGYTVFGEVLYDGMDKVGRDGQPGGIAGMPVWDTSFWHSAFTDMPWREGFVVDPYGDSPTEADMARFRSISQVTGQTYEFISSSDPDMISGSFTGSALTLDVTDEAIGEYALTIRTTDSTGQWFDATLMVEIALNAEMLAANFGMAGASKADGDLNGDGVVDTVDLTILGTYYYSPADAVVDVPEPVTCLLLGMGGLGTILHRRR